MNSKNSENAIWKDPEWKSSVSGNPISGSLISNIEKKKKKEITTTATWNTNNQIKEVFSGDEYPGISYEWQFN